jgi:hypothetical protein
MTVTEYNALETSRRADILWEWAFFIANRKAENYNIAFFSHHDFFIEVRVELLTNQTVSILGISRDELKQRYPELFSSASPAKTFLYKEFQPK